MVADLPQYQYIYLGDNARAPYGSRSWQSVTQYTWESVQKLFSMGCHLVILACNTASAKALRTIQQNYLPQVEPYKRVLGVIRPTTEIIGTFTRSGHIGILGTAGTVQSMSYPIEIEKFFPGVNVYQQACPLWVPLIENNEHLGPGADYFVKKYLDALRAQSEQIDTLLLGCTHYPLMLDKITGFLPEYIKVISQANIVSKSLKDYLERHPDKEQRCLKNGRVDFYTSDDPGSFDAMAASFFGAPVRSKHIEISEMHA